VKTLLIAKLTIRRMIRAQYLIPIVFFCILVVLFFLGQARTSGSNPQRILQSASMSIFLITYFFCFFGSLWLVIAIVPDELNSGHLRMNLTKPASAFSVLTGHTLAAFAYLIFGAFVISLFLTIAVAMRGGQPGWTILLYVLHLTPLYCCLIALGNVLIMFTYRPVAVGLLMILSNERLLREAMQKFEGSSWNILVRAPLEWIATIGYAISPPISRVKINFIEFMGFDFPITRYLVILVYCVTYVILTQLLAAWLLRRKEI
jgi:ABC-type transport system involved in multi-copper enzyme maturation permease subunit